MQRVPSIVLDRGHYTTLTLKLDGGGAITSWRICNKEQIFVSKLSKFTAYDGVKGGIKLCFPKIGEWQFGPTNGFTTMRWNIKKEPYEKDNGDIAVILSTKNDALTESYKHFEFEIKMEATLSESSFTLKFNIVNYSKWSTYVQLMMDCYFKVIDSQKCVTGKYNMKKDPDDEICKMDDAPKEDARQCMDDCPNDCHFLCMLPIRIEGLVNNNRLVIHTTNSSYYDFGVTSKEEFAEDEQYKYLRFRSGEMIPFKLTNKRCFCYHITFEVKTPSLLKTAIEQYTNFIQQYC